MPNPNYSKGVALEREIVNAFRKAGYKACRSAGSHSPYDVFVWYITPPSTKMLFPWDVLYKIGFTHYSVPKLFTRSKGKYIDNIYSYFFESLSPFKERMMMFQCKRKKK